MGQAASKLARAQRRSDLAKRDALPPQEAAALRKLRSEARAAGVELESGGKGGLPPSLVLGVMRRDGFKCKVCGTKERISIHHKGGLENPTSRWLAAKGKSNDPNNLVTLCVPCHDNVHEKDRALG